MRKPKIKKLSLSQGLARSANKKHLTGEARERYIIGGAIRAEKLHEEKLRARKSKAAAPKKKAALPNHDRLELVVRKNSAESAKRSYEVYSLYKPNAKEPYTSATYRKRTVAQQAAKATMEEHNHPKGMHTQNRLA